MTKEREVLVKIVSAVGDVLAGGSPYRQLPGWWWPLYDAYQRARQVLAEETYADAQRVGNEP